MKTKYLLSSLVAAASALALSALAQVGADGGGHHNFLDSLTHAFAHPSTGADHMAAMLACARAFVALLVTGAVAGFVGLWVPGMEPMIAASVLKLDLLVAVQQKIPWVLAAPLAGVFAFLHGAAHGFELAGDTGMAAVGALTCWITLNTKSRQEHRTRSHESLT